jgi:signal transduction histidine kinase
LIYQRSFTVVARGGDLAAIAADDGMLSILQGSGYSPNMQYAVIVDPGGKVIIDPDPNGIGKTLDEKASLDDLLDNQGPIAQLRAIYTPGGLSFELRQPLILRDVTVGSIRVAVSTLLLRKKLMPQFVTPLITAGVVLGASILVAMFLAQLVLRPIHVIRSGLARLGKGELGVNVDLPADAELSEIGQSFQQVSARLEADRTELAGQRALGTVSDQLEDAVALFGPDGTLLFSNATMDRTIEAAPNGGEARKTHDGEKPTVRQLWPENHPYRSAVERALSGGAQQTPAPVTIPEQGDRLVLTSLVPGAAGEPVGALLVSRNLTYLSQVESTLSYSRKLAALSRLTAGIAHEIKNPLNATMIHLELLRMALAGHEDALQHVSVIADQVRRLDAVTQGLMKFTRAEVLHLQAIELSSVFERLRPVLETETAKHGIDLRIDVPSGLRVEGDSNLLEQAFLNLALNACQAMPNGGRLRIAGRAASGRLVTVEVEDSGVGIAAENLSRIFDLYFTTKAEGSGIGLSLVFRTVQLHDGEIEVESTPGRGTTFKVTLRQA